MKAIIKEEIIERINKQIEYNNDVDNIVNIILPILKTYDQKTISKRILTAIKKTIPEYAVAWNDYISFIYITIWDNNNITYDRRLSFTISKKTGYFYYNDFLKDNAYYIDIKNENHKLELIVEYIDTDIYLYNELVKQFNRLEEKYTNRDVFCYPCSEFFKFSYK